MSITPNTPQVNENYTPEPAATPRWIPIVFVLLILALGGIVYVGYSSRTQLQNELATANSHSELLSKELEQTNDAWPGCAASWMLRLRNWGLRKRNWRALA